MFQNEVHTCKDILSGSVPRMLVNILSVGHGIAFGGTDNIEQNHFNGDSLDEYDV